MEGGRAPPFDHQSGTSRDAGALHVQIAQPILCAAVAAFGGALKSNGGLGVITHPTPGGGQQNRQLMVRIGIADLGSAPIHLFPVDGNLRLVLERDQYFHGHLGLGQTRAADADR